MEVFLRSAWNYDAETVSFETGLDCSSDEDKAKQEFKEECDINTILRRFNITGQLPSDVRMPTFGDFTTVYDFQTAVNAIAQANEAFEEMPAGIRARFGNDPAAFVAFCSDPNNLEEARRLGLVPAAELVAPVEAPVAPGGAPVAPGGAPVAPGEGAVTGVT